MRAAGRPPNFARAYRSVPRAFRAAVFTLGGSFAPPGKRALNLNSVQLSALRSRVMYCKLGEDKAGKLLGIKELGMILILVLV